MNRSECQKKVWYRILKVLFIVTLALAVGGLLILSIDGAQWRELDSSRTEITCAENVKNSEIPTIQFTAKDASMELYSGLFKNGIFQYEDFFRGITNDYSSNSDVLSVIFDRCFLLEKRLSTRETIQSQLIFELMEGQGLDYSSAVESSIDTLSSKTEEEALAELSFSQKVFDVRPGYKYLSFMKPILLGLIVILLLWETLRRVLYYVLFGKFLFEDYSPTIKHIENFIKENKFTFYILVTLFLLVLFLGCNKEIEPLDYIPGEDPLNLFNDEPPVMIDGGTADDPLNILD